jgi:hypothetical protein
MQIFKKILLPISIFLLPLIACAENGSVDSILKNANLPKLIGTNQAVNLAAQPVDLQGSSTNVNSFNNFVAIGVVSSPSTQTNMTSFNQDQVILKQISVAGPWIGVAQYLQSEMPNVLLQDGLIAAQACMTKKGTPTPSNEVTNVVIYKTLNTSQFVYDYSFKIPGKTSCQEVLYTPATQGCEWGMQKACHITLQESMVNSTANNKI